MSDREAKLEELTDVQGQMIKNLEAELRTASGMIKRLNTKAAALECIRRALVAKVKTLEKSQ